ncbi:MAG: arginine--tRNA ligase [Candidatus Hydrothermales bacterium]
MTRLLEVEDLIKKIVQNNLEKKINLEVFEPEVKGIDADISFPAFEILSEGKTKVEKILKDLREIDFFEKVEFINGFINIKISDKLLIDSIKILFKNPSRFFRGGKKDGKVLIEYISANPTGPLNVANARAACIGDLLCKSFKITGFECDSEYYCNDEGKQIDLLEISMLERIKEIKGEDFQIPEEGYHGEYLKKLAMQYVKKNLNLNIREFVLKEIIRMQKRSLKRFKTEFKNFYYESEIRKSGFVNEVLKKLSNYTYMENGALFFKSTIFGDEKDRVLVKSDGEYTYFAIDIAYHLSKIKRGYTYLINLWGPDHHGYIKRMESALKVLSFENFKVLIVQQVNLKRGNEIVRMSKRKGEIYSLDDLIKEVGKDAARFFLLLRAPSSPLDFDLEVAKKMSIDNPLYYVQYAHARANQVIEFAIKKGFNNFKIPKKFDVDKKEREILKKIFLIQNIYHKISKNFYTHILPNKLIEISSLFHSFYQSERIVDEKDSYRTQKRLFLVKSLKNLLKFTLNSMGITAPLRM